MRLPNRLAAAVLAGCVVVAAVAMAVTASPGYLLAQRRNQSFQYEARYSTASGVDSLLMNESLTNYPYAFTADMNVLIQRIFATDVMVPLVGNVSMLNFTGCANWNEGGQTVHAFQQSGCHKSILHAGIASDCVAANPFCCVQYWRYPASLPSRLPTDQIDPRLIFWDGTQAVNGFFTNFSDAYRSLYPNCSYFTVWPTPSTERPLDASLAVDLDGEWRFVERTSAIASLVERHMVTPNSSEQNHITLLNGTAAPVWAASHRFGDLPIMAPIIVAAALVALLLLMVLLMYLCAHRPEQKEEAELRMQIEDLEEETAKAEAALEAQCKMRSERRRRSSAGGTGNQNPLASSQRGSFVGSRKVESSAGLSRQNSQAQMQQIDSFASARNRMGPEHRPAPSRNSSMRGLPSDSAFVGASSAGGGMRRHPSSSSMGMQRNPSSSSIGMQRHPSSGSMGMQRHPSSGSMGMQRHPSSGSMGMQRHPSSGSMGMQRNPSSGSMGMQRNPSSGSMGMQRNPSSGSMGMQRNPSSSSMWSVGESRDYENPLVGRQNIDF